MKYSDKLIEYGRWHEDFDRWTHLKIKQLISICYVNIDFQVVIFMCSEYSFESTDIYIRKRWSHKNALSSKTLANSFFSSLVLIILLPSTIQSVDNRNSELSIDINSIEFQSPSIVNKTMMKFVGINRPAFCRLTITHTRTHALIVVNAHHN